jgi:hypothetical protein
MKIKLLIDGKEIPLNEFVNNMLGGTVVGAVTSLRGVKNDWKEIQITVTE